MFKRAIKQTSKLRLAIAGPAGSGKTYTALAIATALGGSVAVVDTEHGSASKYADIFEFDVMEMSPPFHPDRFVQAIREASAAGYSTIVLDSLSHAWNGAGGLLELVEEAQKRLKSNSSFAAWKDVTPIQNRFVDAIVSAQINVIATLRSKQKYVAEPDGQTNRTVVRKVGMEPIQREGFEYEFDIFLEMDINNNAIIGKTRCSALAGRVFAKPGADLAAILSGWLRGEPAPAAPAPPVVFSPGSVSEPASNSVSDLPESTSHEVPAEVLGWEKPEDAYRWAVTIGASDNVFAARNAMKNVVDAHGGRFTKDNAAVIYTAYYYDRLARAQEKSEAG